MHADLVIIGGGLVGASLAAALATHPLTKSLTVVLVDPSPPPAPSSSLSSSWPVLSSPPRTSTITPSSHAFLSDIGAWPLIPEARVAPVDAMLVWDTASSLSAAAASSGALSGLPIPSTVANWLGSNVAAAEALPPAGVMHFAAREIEQDILAYVVDNDTLRTALFHTLHAAMQNPARDLRVVQSSVSNISFPQRRHGHDDINNQEHATAAADNEKSEKHSRSSPEDSDAADPELADADVEWPVITLADGSTIHARLIAACDGPRSRTRSLLGADWLSHAYGETAVVANVRVQDASCVAFQRFLPTGPLALLPLAADEQQYDAIMPPRSPWAAVGANSTHSDHQQQHAGRQTAASLGPLANVVWTTTSAEARALMAADDAAFLDELNVALSGSDMDGGDNDNDSDYFMAGDEKNSQIIMDNASGSTSPSTASNASAAAAASMETPWLSPDLPSPPVCSGVVGKRGSFPLHAGHAPQYVFPHARTVLVGDAAHAVHPLAGQGVNLGFADARTLTDCVAAAAATGRDIGGELGAPLRNYEARRMPANIAAVTGLHALRACFALDGGAATSVRRLGMSLVGGISPVKRTILRFMR